LNSWNEEAGFAGPTLASIAKLDLKMDPLRTNKWRRKCAAAFGNGHVDDPMNAILVWPHPAFRRDGAVNSRRCRTQLMTRL
jgi:hypothetical protein